LDQGERAQAPGRRGTGARYADYRDAAARELEALEPRNFVGVGAKELEALAPGNWRRCARELEALAPGNWRRWRQGIRGVSARKLKALASAMDLNAQSLHDKDCHFGFIYTVYKIAKNIRDVIYM